MPGHIILPFPPRHLRGSLTLVPLCLHHSVIVGLGSNPCQPASPLPPCAVPKEAAPFCSAEFPAPAVTWAKGKRENSRLHIGSRCGPLPALSGNLIKFPRQPGEVLNDQISQLTPLAAMVPLCLPDGWRRILPALSQLANRAGYKGLVFQEQMPLTPAPAHPSFPPSGSKPSCWLLAGQVRSDFVEQPEGASRPLS